MSWFPAGVYAPQDQFAFTPYLCSLSLQLVTHNDVKKMYRKACLAVHPDKQMGSDNENISKLIFTELNDAWAKFQEEEAP